ncbi:MAG: hypothetical protein DHS20C06_02370 [Hyphobacterium sp.]|nr:MAG: hypothetical protein DHS20C06_02370 [Hyphobacterium sp.]
MDSIASILPQIASANGATGNAAPEAAESGLFASLLAAQTTPVSPVPAVNPRPQGDTRFAPQSSTSETGSVLASLTTSLSTPSPAASSTTGNPAETAIPAVNMLLAGDGDLAVQVNAEPAGMQAMANAGGVTAAPIQAQTAEKLSATIAAKSGQNEMDIPAINTKSGQNELDIPAINSKMSPDDGKQESGPEAAQQSKSASIEGVRTASQWDNATRIPVFPAPLAETSAPSSPATLVSPTASLTPTLPPSATATQAGDAAQQPPNINDKSVSSLPLAETRPPSPAFAIASLPSTSTVADAASQSSQSMPEPALLNEIQAGVRARRDSAPTDRAADTIAMSGRKSTGNSEAAGKKSIVPEIKSTPSTQPPTVSAPQMQSPQVDRQSDVARLTAMGDRPTPPPITGMTTTEADADSERVDLSTLRATDASRTAERPATAAGTARFTPTNAGSLAAQIAAKFQNGDRKFAIRMDPPELGKIEVKLHVGNDNRVHAILSAERPETLNDMRQYARDLERALEDAGLQLENDGLSFELSQGQENADENQTGQDAFSDLEFAEDVSGPVTAAAVAAELYGFRLTAPSGVNIRL